jgi:cytoskeletal protein CcmA (bactofilin family)
MAQIIKHRRGSIASLKGTTARNAELIVATGSISDLNGPFVFIGSPVAGDEGVAGAFNVVSKIYQGNSAPTLSVGTYGSTLDGTPFYGSDDKALYALQNSNAGNTKFDLTGNIEGNTISGVTITNLNSTNITASFFTGAFVGDASGLTNVPVSGLTGYNTSKIYSGSVQVTTDSVTGDINVDAVNNVNISGSNINITGSNSTNIMGGSWIQIGQENQDSYFYTSTNYAEMYTNGNVYINGNDYAEMSYNDYDSGLYLANDGNFSAQLYSSVGGVSLNGWNGNSVFINADGGEGDVNVLNGSNKININGNSNFTGSVNISGDTSVTGALVVSNGSATFDQGLVAQNSNMLLTSGSNLIIQDGGNLEVAGNVYITGSEYVDNIYTRTGYATNALHLNGGTFGAPNVELTSSDNISLFAEGGTPTINVTGSMKVTGDVTVEQNMYVSGNIYQTGSFYTQGDIVLSGSINIGNFTGDTINFNGEVTTNILPQTGATYNLGSSGQTWNEVHAEYYYGDGSHLTNISLTGITGLNKIVDGAVSASILEVGGFQVNTDSAITGALDVSGTITADKVHATNDGNGQNFQVGNDMWIGDVNIANTMQVAGFEDFNKGYIQFGDYTNNTNTIGTNGDNLELYSNHDVYVTAEDYLEINGKNEVYIFGSNYGSYIDMYSGYTQMHSDADLYVDAQSYMEIYVNSGNLLISSYDGNILYLNADGGEGDIHAGNGSNNFYVSSYNTFISGSNSTELGQSNYSAYFYTSNDYAEMSSGNQVYVNGYGYVNVEYNEGDSGLYLANDGDFSAQLYTFVGGVSLNSYNGNSVKINADGGEGDIYMLNGGNQLHVDGNSTFTGSMHVSNGLAFVNEGVLAQNSDLTLTSGSNLNINNTGKLYFFNQSVEMYYDDVTSGNLIIYNDNNNGIELRNNVSVTGSLLPGADIMYDLGSTGARWNNVYAQYFNGDGSNLSNIPTSGVTGLDTAKIHSGSVQVTTDSVTGDINAYATNNVNITGSNKVDVYGSVSTYINSDNYTSIGWNDEWNYTYYESGGIYTWSEDGYIEMGGNNNSGESNYIYIENNGVWLQTQHYDTMISGTSFHNVWLDNTGSLNLQNVNLHTDGNIKVGGDLEVTGSLKVSGTTTMSGSVTTYGNLYVSGNLEVFGSSTNVNLESHTVNIGDNIILVNAYSPFQRYAGIAGFDSGSSSNSGSLLWDSLNNYWNFVDDANMSSKLIGTTAAALGSEVSLTTNTLPKATSGNTIGDSLITDNGTVFAYNTNKFSVTGDTGNTYIAGNFTIAGTGVTDNGTYGSYIVFRNSDNTLGFVDGTTDTLTESDRLLGYNASTGVLQFSSLLDGGTY